MKTDSLFFRLFQAMPALALELAGLTVSERAAYQFRSEEIKQTAFRLDGVLMPTAEAQEAPVVFVEVQYQPDEGFYGRFFAEILLYLYRSAPPHPWRAVVIYPHRAVERLNERHYGSLLKLPEVQRVYLEDFAGRPAKTIGMRLIQLLIGNAEQAVIHAVALLRQVRDLPDTELTFQQTLELVETILVYQCPQWGREEIKAMLGLDTELKQTRFYQEVFAEGEAEGKRKGQLEGKLEGKLEGNLEGELKLLRRLLIRRFGPLPDWAERRLMDAEPAQLERWGEQVLEAKALEDVFIDES